MSGTAATAVGTPREELLDIAEIQGNILAGFNKDHQHFLFLRIHDRQATKDWLLRLTPQVATTEEVLLFNRLFRRLRRRRQAEPRELLATWLNLAFTFSGLAKLIPAPDAAQLERLDLAFALGLHQRSTLLGDPQTATMEGHSSRWVVGGAHNEADVLLIVAGDDRELLSRKVVELQDGIFALPRSADGRPALEILYSQAGEARPDLPGHEHFGFKDAISQPGIRGRVSRAADDFLTPRLISPSDPQAQRFARPGQPLLFPGQFVLGYQTQDSVHPLRPRRAKRPRPAWAKNGSFLVVRRLKQDVLAFWSFLTAEASRLAQRPGFVGITPERLGALLVGRWPSGAPLLRAGGADRPELGQDSLANNHFIYGSDSAAIPLTAANYPGDPFPQAHSDLLGAVCPHAAHIRKINPRDLGSDTGGPNDTLTRMILRRGIPFGPPIRDPRSPQPADLQAERGLMFLCYQASISNQFEFLTNHWSNSPNQPEAGGHDPIIGQREGLSGERRRQVELLGSDGSRELIELPSEWVIPTGGGYFFAPAISALSGILAR